MQALFWLSICALAYTYGLYPIFLQTLLLVFRFTSRTLEQVQGSYQPVISVIIAAYNEEQVIGRRIANILDQDYPTALLEVIIVSDGSTDKTNEIVSANSDSRVRLCPIKERRGRALAHNHAVQEAEGDIIVFSDAETLFADQFLRRIEDCFRNPSVGCVVGQLRYRNSRDSTIGEHVSLYWQYELHLRRLESHLGLLATASGACMAVRKALYKPLAPDEDVDFITPLDVIAQDHRVVYEPTAVASDLAPATVVDEVRSRARMTTKNLLGTLRKLKTMPLWQYSGIWWSILSHKILRWFTPLFLLSALTSNAFLLHRRFYAVFFALQVTAYLIAAFGFVADQKHKHIPIASSLFSFIVANIGMFLGILQVLRGVKIAAYETHR